MHKLQIKSFQTFINQLKNQVVILLLIASIFALSRCCFTSILRIYHLYARVDTKKDDLTADNLADNASK